MTRHNNQQQNHQPAITEQFPGPSADQGCEATTPLDPGRGEIRTRRGGGDGSAAYGDAGNVRALRLSP